MAEELKPCPFCGCTDIIGTGNGSHEWFECDWCGASSGQDPSPEYDGMSPAWNWNRRDYSTLSPGDILPATADRPECVVVPVEPTDEMLKVFLPKAKVTGIAITYDDDLVAGFFKTLRRDFAAMIQSLRKETE